MALHWDRQEGRFCRYPGVPPQIFSPGDYSPPFRWIACPIAPDRAMMRYFYLGKVLTKSLFLRTEPLLAGHQDELSIQSVLVRLAGEKATGVLVLSPSGAQLHVRAGLIEALEGVEDLNETLLRLGVLDSEALKKVDPQSSDLHRQLKALLSSEALKAALQQQIRFGLSYLLRLQNQRYAFYRHSPLPAPTAELPLVQALLEATEQQIPLPLNQPLRLARFEKPLLLDKAEWALLRWLNGRRSLGSILQLSGLGEEEGHAAVRSLLSKGLLEPAAVQGLRLIVPERAHLGNNYHPPASIKANLLLKTCDGERTAEQIGREIKASAEETASLLCMLYREGLLCIRSGQPEFERLLEEY